MSCRSISISTGLFCWSLSIEIGHFLTYIYVVQITRPRIWRSKASRPSLYLAIISICTRCVYSEDSFTLSCAVFLSLSFYSVLLRDYTSIYARFVFVSVCVCVSLSVAPLLSLSLARSLARALLLSRSLALSLSRSISRTLSRFLSRACSLVR